ncbi:MAG: heme-binding domain-containing protein, partial [Flavobacteriales bacterium]|nr:heme-binding domain-containing protein [Flavobacteriales bacterium]
MKKKIGIAVLAIIIILQFFRIDKVNPEAVLANDFIVNTNPDEKTIKLLKSACYDCHSNTTEYPWYSNIAPVSWWLKDHIDEAR